MHCLISYLHKKEKAGNNLQLILAFFKIRIVDAILEHLLKNKKIKHNLVLRDMD